MKNKKEKELSWKVDAFLYVFLLIFLSILFQSCADECEVEQQLTYYEPVYTTLEDLRSSVGVVPGQEINETGKIFFKDNFLFINEPNEGIHVIDNRNPANPLNIAFIEVPGSFDLAVNNNLLYTDSYIDLVIIDISAIDDIKEVGRLENVFSNYNSYGHYVDSEKGLVTDWKLSSSVEVLASDCEGNVNWWGNYYRGGIAVNELASFDAAVAVSPSNPGMAGSMARFGLTQNHLYTLDLSDLIAFDLTTPLNPVAGERQHIDWGIETIFPHGDKLFLGANDGMYILDLENPISPTLITTYKHVRSCDPVIVDGDYAFVTLRSGSQCQGFTNQLEVINISDITSPILEYVYPMTNPHGLGKDGDVLFICDGSDGLKAYDVSDLAEIDENLLAHYGDIQAIDVIAFNNIAMMIGQDGLYQYDYSNLNDIKFLSHIKVHHNAD